MAGRKHDVTDLEQEYGSGYEHNKKRIKMEEDVFQDVQLAYTYFAEKNKLPIKNIEIDLKFLNKVTKKANYMQFIEELRKPNYDSSYRIQFCSDIAVQLTAVEMARKNYHDLAKIMEAAFNGGASTLAGNIFERMFLNYIQSPDHLKKPLRLRSLPATENDEVLEGTIKFRHVNIREYKPHRDSSTKENETSNNDMTLDISAIVSWDGNTDLSSVAEGTFLVPKSRTQPIVDFLLQKGTLFQVTLANRHPYVNQHLIELVRNWWHSPSRGASTQVATSNTVAPSGTSITEEKGKQMNKPLFEGMKLFYVVPPSRFDTFCFQKPLTATNKVFRTIKSNTTIQQFVIEFDWAVITELQKKLVSTLNDYERSDDEEVDQEIELYREARE